MTTIDRAAHPRRSLLRRPRRRRHRTTSLQDPDVRAEINDALREVRTADLRGRRADAEDAGRGQHRLRTAQGPPEPGDAPRRRRRPARRDRDAPRTERAGHGLLDGRAARRSGCRGTSTTATTTSSTGPACCAPSRCPPTKAVDRLRRRHRAVQRDLARGARPDRGRDRDLRDGRDHGQPPLRSTGRLRRGRGRRAGDRGDDRVRRSAPRAPPRGVDPCAPGEKVLHVSPWMAKGIEGREDTDGDALLAAVCDEIVETAQGPQLLPPMAADRHGHLGQLALPAPRVGNVARSHAVHAPHDDRGRLRPRPIRGRRTRSLVSGTGGGSTQLPARDRRACSPILRGGCRTRRRADRGGTTPRRCPTRLQSARPRRWSSPAAACPCPPRPR